jgi:hypothetical protein
MPARAAAAPLRFPAMDRTLVAPPSPRGWVAAVVAVAARPVLWPAALRLVVHLAPRGWWRRPPFVPRPDPAYLEFRMVTAFGPEGRTPPAPELVSYLRWLRAWPEVTAR